MFTKTLREERHGCGGSKPTSGAVFGDCLVAQKPLYPNPIHPSRAKLYKRPVNYQSIINFKNNHVDKQSTQQNHQIAFTFAMSWNRQLPSESLAIERTCRRSIRSGWSLEWCKSRRKERSCKKKKKKLKVKLVQPMISCIFFTRDTLLGRVATQTSLHPPTWFWPLALLRLLPRLKKGSKWFKLGELVGFGVVLCCFFLFSELTKPGWFGSAFG